MSINFVKDEKKGYFNKEVLLISIQNKFLANKILKK